MLTSLTVVGPHGTKMLYVWLKKKIVIIKNKNKNIYIYIVFHLGGWEAFSPLGELFCPPRLLKS